MNARHTSRRLWLFLIPFFLLASLGIAQSGSMENHFDFVYQVRVQSIPKNAGDVKIWVPLAPSNEYQKIQKVEIDTPYAYQVFEDPDYGNKILHLSFDKPPAEDLEFHIRYEVSVSGEKANYEALRKGVADSTGTTKPVGDEGDFQLYLMSPPNSLLVINDKIRKIAREVTKGKKTDLDKAKAIYDYVIGHMIYDKSGVGWGFGNAIRACEVGRGNCTDFHALFICLARAVGIPARFKIGAQIPENQAEGTVGYHCWAEFYLPEEGWIPVDASEAWKNPQLRDFYFGSRDPGKFLISLGRDISLRPAQKGERINIFLKPYVEVDGEPLESVDSQFYFKSRQKQEG